MKHIHPKILFAIICISSLVLSINSAMALGLWDKGTVTKKPWKDKYIFIKIDKTKYTIMDNSKLVMMYTEDGSTYEKPIKMSSIKVGDTVLFQVEGNRIYSIQQVK